MAVLLYSPQVPPLVPPALTAQLPYMLKVIAFVEISLTIVAAAALMIMSVVVLKRMRAEERGDVHRGHDIGVDLGYAEYSSLSAERLGEFEAAQGGTGSQAGERARSGPYHGARDGSEADSAYVSPDGRNSVGMSRGGSGSLISLGGSTLYDRMSNRSFRSVSDVSETSEYTDTLLTPRGRQSQPQQDATSWSSWLFGDW